MKLEEIVKKAKNKEIKLEDLTKEEILKFDNYDSMFLITALMETFGLSKKDVNRIKRKKGIEHITYEKYYRNYIILMDYCMDTYGITNFEFARIMNQIIYESEFVDMHPELKSMYKRLEKIDWSLINPKKEIEEKEIDVEFRLKHYERDFTYLKFAFGLLIEELNEIKPTKITKEKYIPQKRPRTRKVSKVTKTYTRNPEISENALKLANYLCEFDKSHPTFIRKKKYLNYMEPHHLIPLEFQDEFEYSLDTEANIISLCSNCHNEIHYGINNKKMIEKFYKERKNNLIKSGIDITLDELYSLYEIEIKEEVKK